MSANELNVETLSHETTDATANRSSHSMSTQTGLRRHGFRTARAVTLGVLLAASISSSARAQVMVPGFKPSTGGFAFSNSFPEVPHTTLDVAGVQIPIGNAANGLCGGMVFAARDYFEAGMARPSTTTPPGSGPLYDYIVTRLYDSFDLPNGSTKNMHLMNPDLPDHETWFSMTFGFPRGRAWVTIVEEWPLIKQDLDQGKLSPMSLILVKSHDPFMLGHNHQVLAWGYDLVGNDLTIYVYDPNYPNNDNITISLNIGNPQATTDMFFSVGNPLFAFFHTQYTYVQPFGLVDGMVAPEPSATPVANVPVVTTAGPGGQGGSPGGGRACPGSRPVCCEPNEDGSCGMCVAARASCP